MIINHNLNAMNAHRNNAQVITEQGKSSEKLSSGYRINRAADDAAGLSISEKMRSQIKSLNQAQSNAQDGISLVQTAEGALTEVSDMLTRLKELSVKAQNGTYSTTDQTAMQSEATALTTAIDDIATKTRFNGTAILQTAAGYSIQTGENSGDQVIINTASTTATSLGISGLQITVAANMTKYDAAIEKVNSARSDLGAKQNQLEHVSNNLGATSENLQSAESRIRDVDMAKEMMNYSKLNILQQASTSMMAQANQAPQGVLKLLQ
jgi:flagellin